MANIKPTVDIIKEIVNSLTFTENILSLAQNGTEWTIKICDNHHLRPCSKIQINGTDYEVKSIDGSGCILIDTADSLSLGVLVIPAPFYIHGTWLAATSEIKQIPLSSDKYPLVYLFEVLEDRFNTNPLSTTGRESKLRLFFLDEADRNNWLTEDHYEGAINPMTSLAEDFIGATDNSKLVVNNNDAKEHSLRYHANFGKVTEEGHTKYLFSDFVSGVEMNVTIPFTKKGCEVCEC